MNATRQIVILSMIGCCFAAAVTAVFAMQPPASSAPAAVVAVHKQPAPELLHTVTIIGKRLNAQEKIVTVQRFAEPE